MRMTNITVAKKQAQSNANYFGVPFCVFTSTGGEIYVERDFSSAQFNKEVFNPENKEQQK